MERVNRQIGSSERLGHQAESLTGFQAVEVHSGAAFLRMKPEAL
jgi:hypothetical protein